MTEKEELKKKIESQRKRGRPPKAKEKPAATKAVPKAVDAEASYQRSIEVLRDDGAFRYELLTVLTALNDNLVKLLKIESEETQEEPPVEEPSKEAQVPKETPEIPDEDLDLDEPEE